MTKRPLRLRDSLDGSFWNEESSVVAEDNDSLLVIYSALINDVARFNDEARMAKSESMTNDEAPNAPLRHSGFVIVSGLVIRASSFSS